MMPIIKRPLNTFGLQTLIRINSMGMSQAELAEQMRVKPSNLCTAMHKENPSATYIKKWTRRVDEALKNTGG